MSQYYRRVSGSPSVATSYVTDDGTVSAIGNVLNVNGVSSVKTDGNTPGTLKIILTDVAENYVRVTNAESPYTVLADDYFISCDSSGGPVSILLPDSPTQYDQFVVKDGAGNSSDPTKRITVTTVAGVVLIDGDTSVVFTDDYESLELLFNGTSYESF